MNPIEDNGTSLYDEKQIKAVNELKKKTDIQFIREDILHEENVKRRSEFFQLAGSELYGKRKYSILGSFTNQTDQSLDKSNNQTDTSPLSKNTSSFSNYRKRVKTINTSAFGKKSN